MTTTDSGRSPDGSGYSAEPEPVPVSAVPVSIPNARELWRSGCPDYPDIVFVTEAGEIGMKADFGRAVVMPVGQWHYLTTEVARLSAGYAAFPRDVAAVLSRMGDVEHVLPAKEIATDLCLPEKRVREIQRALRALGLSDFGVLCADTEAYAPRGSGYWATLTGEQLSYALHASGIEAGTDETPQAAQPEGREPGPTGDAQPLPSSDKERE